LEKTPHYCEKGRGDSVSATMVVLKNENGEQREKYERMRIKKGKKEN
jgi:hypothetical protein